MKITHITTAELERLTGRPEGTWKYWARRGVVPAIRVDGTWRIEQAAALARHEVATRFPVRQTGTTTQVPTQEGLPLPPVESSAVALLECLRNLPLHAWSLSGIDPLVVGRWIGNGCPVR